MQRWIEAEVFCDVVHDLREMIRKAKGRNSQPSAAILDGRTLQSTCESRGRAGYEGAREKKGSKAQMAVDTLANLDCRTQRRQDHGILTIA